MLIGFTGTQKGMTTRQKQSLENMLAGFKTKPYEFHHGDCEGADEQAHNIAKKHVHLIVIHPPRYHAKRAFCFSKNIRTEKDYLERNHDIVDETETLYAAPRTKDEELRSGTWATIRYARKIGKPVTLFYPDGTVDIPV